MTDVRDRTEALLSDNPEWESDLEHLLELDKEGAWSFHDTSLDSGSFGEIVSEGLAEDTGDGYRLTDREAIAAAVRDETVASEGRSNRSLALSRVIANSRLLPSRFTRDSVGVIGLGLGFVVLLRTVFVFGDVYRDGRIVLSGNDPYRYRFWVEHLLQSGLSAFDPTVLGRLPAEVVSHDVLMIVTLWWTASLFGSGARAAGTVLAWYPVVVAVLVGLLIYFLTVRVTEDRRSGFAALLFFALTPVSTYRTTLGFGDHHAFDYLWFTVMLMSLVLLAQTDAGGDVRAWSPAHWVSVGGIGIGIAFQTLAWRGGPLLIAVVGLYGVGKALLDVHRGRQPLSRNLGLLVGTAGGAVIVLGAHFLWGWLPLFRAAAPLLLAAGLVSVFAVGDVAVRTGRDVRTTVVTLAILSAGGLLVLWTAVPPVAEGLSAFLEYMRAYTGSEIAETKSLLSPSLGLFIAPVLFFGFILFLALPYLAVASYRAVQEDLPEWLVLSVVGWYLFLLSVLQVRFAGQLAMVTAVFAGIGFVDLAARVDILSAPTLFSTSGPDEADPQHTSADRERSGSIGVPDRQTGVYLLVLFLLVSGMALVQVPIKQSQLAIDGEDYEAARWMGEYSSDRGWTYPENYVFSQWGKNMMYNYFVSGYSKNYDFAKPGFQRFMASQSPEQWYQKLAPRTGFVVVPNVTASDWPTGSMAARLDGHNGSSHRNVAATSHYRLVYVAADSSLKVFTLVPGARVTGRAAANETLVATASVETANSSFTFRTQVTTDQRGKFNFTTPHPGTYTIGNTTVTVPERAVRNGGQVNATGST